MNKKTSFVAGETPAPQEVYLHNWDAGVHIAIEQVFIPTTCANVHGYQWIR